MKNANIKIPEYYFVERWEDGERVDTIKFFSVVEVFEYMQVYNHKLEVIVYSAECLLDLS